MFKLNLLFRGVCMTGVLVITGNLPSLRAAGDDDLLDTPAPASATAPKSSDDLDGPVPVAPPKTEVSKAESSKPLTSEQASDEHARLFTESKFPSATTCAVCHPAQFREWSVSSHAYAQLSPVFNAMQATIVKETSGTNGDFCIRCHTQVGMQLKESVYMSNLDRSPTAREGITCIVCHRVNLNYGKVSGRTSINEGDVFAPVYGPRDGSVLKQVLADPDKYKVVTTPGQNGRAIHTQAFKFDPITKSGFCGTCHDVNLLNGFRLEEAFSQFKNSPANKKGITCQDCHMGKIQGIASGYSEGPAATIGGVPTPSRKRTNHMFPGPDYSIVHIGLFPHNTKAQKLATMREWLTFDDKAGWGSDAFENHIPKNYEFPARWKSVDDRYDARAVIEEQNKLLGDLDLLRHQLLRRGYQLHKFDLEKNNAKGIDFRIEVANATDGHGTPTGFDAERMVILQVTVTDSTGRVVFQSGDRDPNGDVRDVHSAYVNNWELPVDHQLFTLQSKFITRNLRGGEREQVIPVDYSLDPLPYVRPETRSHILTARTTSARKQARLLPPLSSRWADYHVDSAQLTGVAPYKLKVTMISQMVPVNVMREIGGVGFDYHMSAREIAYRIVEGARVLWDKEVVLDSPEMHLDWTPTEAEIMAPPAPRQAVVRDPISQNAPTKDVQVAKAR
ncbi:MAG: multiheme c-type cytochrome [Opitutaceae bacterium]